MGGGCIIKNIMHSNILSMLFLVARIVQVFNLYMGYKKNIIIYEVNYLRKILSKFYPSEYWDGWKFMVGDDKRYAFIIPPDS